MTVSSDAQPDQEDLTKLDPKETAKKLKTWLKLNSDSQGQFASYVLHRHHSTLSDLLILAGDSWGVKRTKQSLEKDPDFIGKHRGSKRSDCTQIRCEFLYRVNFVHDLALIGPCLLNHVYTRDSF